MLFSSKKYSLYTCRKVKYNARDITEIYFNKINKERVRLESKIKKIKTFRLENDTYLARFKKLKRFLKEREKDLIC